MPLTLDPTVGAAMMQLAGMAGIDMTTKPPPGDVDAMRERFGKIFGTVNGLVPFPEDVVAKDIHIPNPDGSGHQLLLKWYKRKDDTRPKTPAILYTHGGGMIFGSTELYAPFNALQVAATNVPILAVDYRLAPEHPHPSIINECWAGLQYLAQHAADLGVDPEKIAVQGDSAGGNLAAALAIRARDEKGPKLARQILVYPMLDDKNLTPDPSIAPFATWDYDANALGWGSLLGKDHVSKDITPWAAPARLKDYTGLPPAWIGTGELDIFRDEDIKYAQELLKAGTSAALVVYPGVPHAFNAFAAMTAVSAQYNEDLNREVKKLNA